MIDKYFNALYSYWLYDLSIFENPWMYVPFLIPIILYIPFFVLKWWVLTLPIWLPIKIVLNAIFRNK